MIIAVFNWRLNRNIVYLSIFLSIQALSCIAYSLFLFGGSVFLYALLLNNIAPLYFTLGPFMYLFVRGLVYDNQKFHKIDLLHFIPFVLHLLAIIPYLLTSFDYKLDIARSLMQQYEHYKTYNFMLFYPHYINNIARALQFSTYIAISISMLVKAYPKIKHKTSVVLKQHKYTYKFLFILLTSFFLLSVSNLYVSIVFETTTTIDKILPMSFTIIYFALSIYIAVPIYILFNPRILYGMPQFIESEPVTIIENKIKKKVSEPKPKDSVEFQLSKDIMQYLEVEKPYLKLDFSIHDICNHFNTPQHHIQYCFSNVLNRHFRDIKSELRVKYAIELLNSNMANNISMEGIGRQAGFASNSNFYTSFKVVSGVTPNQWLLNIKDEELLCYKS